MDKKGILVVCIGNIHRSPIAETFLNREFARQGLADHFYAFSRGIQGSADAPAPEHLNLKFYERTYEAAKPSLDRFQIDLSEQVATPINREAVEQASIVLAMDELVLNHPKYPQAGLLAQFPDAVDKIHLLTDLVNEDIQIEDLAASTDPEAFMRHAEQLADIARRGVARIATFLDDTHTELSQEVSGIRAKER